MTSMKIENYTGTASTFTWPNNPQVFDGTLTPNYSVTQIGFQRHHIFVSGGGFSPSTLILNGQLNGTSMWANYRLMSAHFGDTTSLKKLFFESDKFYLGIGKQIKKTHSGGRTNFIDYVASFETIIGILFSSTEKTSGTNAGNTTTYITKVVGDYDGSGDVTITDDLGTVVTVPASEFSGTEAFVFELVKMVDSGSGIYVTEYAYVTIDGTQTRNVQITGGFLPQLAAGANVSTVVVANLTDAVVTFRDGYVD